MYKITVDSSCSIIEVVVAGLLSLDEVLAYCAEVEPLIAKCAAKAGYRMLIDLSECAIQTQEVVGAFLTHAARMPKARASAIITGRSIIRMQIRRVMAGRELGIFDNRSAALAWLARCGDLSDAA